MTTLEKRNTIVAIVSDQTGVPAHDFMETRCKIRATSRARQITAALLYDDIKSYKITAKLMGLGDKAISYAEENVSDWVKMDTSMKQVVLRCRKKVKAAGIDTKPDKPKQDRVKQIKIYEYPTVNPFAKALIA